MAIILAIWSACFVSKKGLLQNLTRHATASFYLIILFFQFTYFMYYMLSFNLQFSQFLSSLICFAS